MLQQWANESRILETTQLEPVTGGQMLYARELPGLIFPSATPPAQPAWQTFHPPPAQPGFSVTDQPQENQWQQAPAADVKPTSTYYRPGPAAAPAGTKFPGEGEVTTAWICGAFGLVCCFLLSFVGLMSAHKAKKLGHPHAQGAYIFNVVALCIQGGLWILYLIGTFALGSLD